MLSLPTPGTCLPSRSGRVLARLSLLRGAWDRAAARAIAQATAPILAALADTALVRRVAAGGETRYMLHELVRQYAGEQLESNPAEAAAAAARHARWYADRVNSHVGALQSGSQQIALARLSPDLDNIWLAWTWAVRHADGAMLCNMARGIVTICEDLGRLVEGVNLFAKAVAAISAQGPCDPETEGTLRNWHGYFLSRCGQLPAAEQQLQAALAIMPAEDRQMRGQAHAHLALLRYQQGQYREAMAWAEAAERELAATGDAFYHGLAVCFMGLIAIATGEPMAATWIASGAAIWRKIGHTRGLIITLSCESRLALAAGQPEQALRLAGEIVRITAQQRDRWGMAFALLHLGHAALAAGDAVEAGYLFAESAETASEVGEQWVRCQALAGIGRAAIAAGTPDAAREALREAIRLGQAALLLPALLESLLGLALLHSQEQPQSALRWLLYVCQHPASDVLLHAEAERQSQRLLQHRGQAAESTDLPLMPLDVLLAQALDA